VHLLAAWNQWSANPLADLKEAVELAQKALAVDDTNSTAHALLCESDWMLGRYDQAVVDGKRAVAINPNYAQGYQVLADALDVDGKAEDAIPASEKAMRLDPAHADLFASGLGMAYVEMGSYETAILILKRHVAAYPNLPIGHMGLVVAYTELGRRDDARAEAAEIMRISPGFTVASIPLTNDAAWNKRSHDDLHNAGLK
jgi:adenylate cyclase